MNDRQLKVVFFGVSGEYALTPLRQIARAHDVVAIVESGPRLCKKKRLSPLDKLGEYLFALAGIPSLWFYARRRRLPYFYYCPAQQDRLIQFLQGINPDIGCVASFNHLLKPAVYQTPRLGMINFHPSLLPAYRGPQVWPWLYIDFVRQGGATIHFLDEGEDTGDILKQETIPIPLGIDQRSLENRLIHLGGRLMTETLDELARGELNPRPQKHLACSQRARRIRADEDLLDWQKWSLEHTYHYLSGMSPWHRPLAKTRGWLDLWPWRATSYQMAIISPTAAGKVRMDGQGFYFAHPQGKIRLRVDPAIIRFLMLLMAGAATVLFLLSR